MLKVVFHTLGCKVNQYETEAMEELFENRGYQLVNENDYADIYVINTCTVTNMSDRKSRQFIRKAKRINKDAIVAVVGCYSQVSPDEVEKIEDVDVIIGTSERNKIVDLCEESLLSKKRINIVRPIKTYKEFEKIKTDQVRSKTRAFLKIQDGCNQFCSYCIIPYARGPIRSRNFLDIEQETRNLAEAGFKEIVLTGIHIASYGKDLGGIKLIDVIDKISEIKGIERIRMSSVEPNLIDDEFMKRISVNKKVCDHFHLSLQSGSDSVLSRMNRKYTTSEYKEKALLIKKYMPNVGLTTDIIVGFPGETDEEFEETYNYVKEIGFSRIHIFKYSKRRGTPAAQMKDQINGEIKNYRSKRLIELGNILALDFHNKFLQKKLSVLFEEKDKKNRNIYEGYTTNYIRSRVFSNCDIIGEIKDFKAEESNTLNLEGSLV
ncbi:MAG: tRNA (N(6)-L-threonylcarbamoyladenosine(37)-C(2))-methylthiotransferase MtaB [Gudongella sp.]|nr:tRNA (N(6)-L-threonylcarbamoyladenosine(37)-C(2))-methylthiotransferase MtaB [Gudongella sp.]